MVVWGADFRISIAHTKRTDFSTFQLISDMCASPLEKHRLPLLCLWPRNVFLSICSYILKFHSFRLKMSSTPLAEAEEDVFGEWPLPSAHPLPPPLMSRSSFPHSQCTERITGESSYSLASKSSRGYDSLWACALVGFRVVNILLHIFVNF